MKKVFILLSLLTVIIFSCGNEGKQEEKGSGSNEVKKKVRIGITQIVAHPALDNAREGFKEALKKIEDLQNMYNVEINFFYWDDLVGQDIKIPVYIR